jgi:type IV secretion system protein VirB6
MFALVPLLTVVMGSGALAAIAPMVDGLGQAGTDIPLKTAVSILVASIIYLSLMLLIFKVAANLTRGWRMSRAQAFAQNHFANAFGGAHQHPALVPAPAVAAGAPAAAITSDRVRSTVASLETMSTSYRLPAPAVAALAAPAPAPQLAVAGPVDARGQLRYLHHRVAGASTPVSKEMLR